MASTPLSNLRRIQRALLSWHRVNGLHAPWRDTGDPYEVLVAAVMAQQTQMSRVMPSYERFIAAYPTLDALATASLGDVIRTWKGMGYNQRAVRLHRAARTIADGGWPHDAESLARIDGIGPFTAAIIASFSFGQPAAAVDTNVVRVLTRLAGDDTLRGKRLQDLADAVIPDDEPARWNQALMDYGARICTPRPKCPQCVVATLCPSMDRFRRATAVGAQPAAPATSRTKSTRTQPADSPETTKVAEPRQPYVAAPDHRANPPTTNARRTPTPYEHSDRYFRGRIIDVLRALPPTRTITVADIPARIANERAPSEAEVRTWLEALEQAGLIERKRDRVRLPI